MSAADGQCQPCKYLLSRHSLLILKDCHGLLHMCAYSFLSCAVPAGSNGFFALDLACAQRV
jgi:hypothetical protein